MSFRSVFRAVVIAFALILAAFLLNGRGRRWRPNRPAQTLCVPPENARNVIPGLLFPNLMVLGIIALWQL